ncbi:uncharacterized protein LOC144459362 [Epinephelus lanceolatus]
MINAPVPVSPTGALQLAKLKEQAKMDRQKIEHLEDCIKYLEEANRDLKNDKDFLLSQMKGPPSMPASTGKGSGKTSSSSSSMSPSSSSDSSFSSSSNEEENKKKKKKKTKKSKKQPDSHGRSRMTTTDGVIRRYKNALRIFNKSGSILCQT